MSEGFSFVVSPHVLIGTGRRTDRMDGVADRQARHRRLRLQTSWMAIGKDQRHGWALPLLAHCGVHLAVALTLILIVAPRFWFVAGSISHSHHGRPLQGCWSRFGVTQENQHPWFWTLIGVDQALHHLTGFGLSIFMAAN